MADKRMFSKRITDSDAFVEMPSATQALYFHLNQAADDDGFNNQIQIAMMKAHASADDLKILLMKRFIIRFESGVIVIKHWRMHNTLRNDRYTPTAFQDELAQLNLKDNKSYTLLSDGCQTVAKLATQYSIDKNSIDNMPPVGSKKPPKKIYGAYKNVKLLESEVEKLVEDFGQVIAFKAIEFLSAYREEKGYKAKSDNLSIRRWVIDAVKKTEKTSTVRSVDVPEGW